MAYHALMEFKETPFFTRQIRSFSDEEYRLLQQLLIIRPDAGKLIQGSGGCRKMRWGIKGKGKSGGARVIYYWDSGAGIYMLYLYEKADQADLTPMQIATLKRTIEQG